MTFKLVMKCVVGLSLPEAILRRAGVTVYASSVKLELVMDGSYFCQGRKRLQQLVSIHIKLRKQSRLEVWTTLKTLPEEKEGEWADGRWGVGVGGNTAMYVCLALTKCDRRSLVSLFVSSIFHDAFPRTRARRKGP